KNPVFQMPLLDWVLGSWGVTYPEALQGLTGSCVVIPCTFSYPSSVSASAGIVAIWYKDFDGQKTVVYHSAAQDEVDGRFRSRTRLLGDPAEHNCTLLLREVTTEDSGTYRFRFEIVNGDRWSAARDVMLMVWAKAISSPLVWEDDSPKRQHQPVPGLPPNYPPLSCPPVLQTPLPPQKSLCPRDAVNLTCALARSGRGALSYTWYKDNAWFSGGPAPSLAFPRVASTDAASYRCGPAVILACAVESNPPAELTLRRAGEVLAASPARGGAGRPEPNALRLELGTAVAAAAEGEYECRARSPLGSSRTSLHLRLQRGSFLESSWVLWDVGVLWGFGEFVGLGALGGLGGLRAHGSHGIWGARGSRGFWGAWVLSLWGSWI
uniref:Sialic acid binding Ig like lectin 1 n=1 Tax=Apteryx owenii TaxID=8824 RepID=A0A8B9PTC1_APTOW